MFGSIPPFMPGMTGNVLRPVSPMNAAPMHPLIPYMGRSLSPVGGALPLMGTGLPAPSIMHPGFPPQHLPMMMGLPQPNYLSRWNNTHTSQLDAMKKYIGREPDVVINKPGGMAIWKKDKVTYILNDHNKNGYVPGTGANDRKGMVSTIIRLKSIPTPALNLPPGIVYDRTNLTLHASSDTIGNTIHGIISTYAYLQIAATSIAVDGDNKNMLDKSKLED
uniref:Uncharacterized protein n=1 Tax=viral metagenome TaxID=1070528 RepID=A0A6C0J5Y6_9ZZZZ